MKKYSLIGIAGSGTADKTICTVTGAATVRPNVVEIILGNAETPADYAWSADLQRFTADGTGTAHVPRLSDPSDPVAQCTAKITHTVEPTYTSAQVVLQISTNMRNPVRWVAMDEDRDGFKGPATAANGLGLIMKLATTALIGRATVRYVE